MYRHRQLGWFVLVLNTVLVMFLGGMAAATRRWPFAVMALVAAALAWVFTTLTTEVADGAFRFWFGPGVWRKRWPLEEIAEARATRSRFWEGIGIRITTRGMLYNVAAGPAVELRLRSGERLRVGTDEPERLLAALGRPGGSASPASGP